MAVHVVSGIEGSKHDKLVFDDSIDDFIEKVRDFHKDEPLLIIGDKGYQEPNSQILVTPKKGTYFDLTPEELLNNEKLSKIRIIVENFFGRLKSRYRIFGDQYRGCHISYESIFNKCCTLINYEILTDHPLRKEDHDFFLRHRAIVFKSIEEEKRILKIKAEQQKKDEWKNL